MSTEVIEEFTEDAARQLMVDRFGPQCAAWLTWGHRKLLHRRGAFDVVVPAVDRLGKPYALPSWFEIAMACLRKRPGWSVDVLRHRGDRHYRVRWHAWTRQLRALPPSIARVT